MEREELEAIIEKDVVQSGGGREPVCGCGCLPLAQKAGCQVGPKEGGR